MDLVRAIVGPDPPQVFTLAKPGLRVRLLVDLKFYDKQEQRTEFPKGTVCVVYYSSFRQIVSTSYSIRPEGRANLEHVLGPKDWMDKQSIIGRVIERIR